MRNHRKSNPSFFNISFLSISLSCRHSKKSSKSRRSTRSKSAPRDSSSTNEKDRKGSQASSSQSTSVATSATEPMDKVTLHQLVVHLSHMGLQEAEQCRLEDEMQKRKNRIEQWRAERRMKLGIDQVMQQSVAQAGKLDQISCSPKTSFVSSLRAKRGH